MTLVDRRQRTGFTLIEVIVALVLGGGTVLLASAMLSTMSAHSAAVSEVVSATDHDANGERVLRRLVGQMRLPRDDEQRLRGDTQWTRFDSWCELPAGWQEPCAVELFLRSDDGAPPGLLARLSTGEELRLLGGVGIAGLLYLESAEHGGRWRTSWDSNRVLPRAIGVATETDTLIIVIGERG